MSVVSASSEPAVAPSTLGESDAARKQMFIDFCLALESHAISYVILSGYQGYPDRIDSDVDFMVSDTDFNRLSGILNDPRSVPGARLVQILQHETSACYFVLAKQIGQHMVYLHPDAAANYRRGGRLWLHSSTVLASRRKLPAGFWVPAAAVEFEYYFIKRVDKALIEQTHLQWLGYLMQEDPVACQAALQRLVTPELRQGAIDAISKCDLNWFETQRHQLKSALRSNPVVENMFDRLAGNLRNQFRKLRRVLKPTGLIVAVLGPDGSGKTTVIKHIEGEMAPAFRRVKTYHLRPHFGITTENFVVKDPHGQSARGYLASTLKIAMFVSDYWYGWVRFLVPSQIRSTLVIFDRYYHDMLVDSKRYRLPARFVLASLGAMLIPKPDLWLILAAQPEQLVSRKGEITLDEANRLTTAYRTLADALPNAKVVDTSKALEQTLAEATTIVRNHLETRAQLRLRARSWR